MKKSREERKLIADWLSFAKENLLSAKSIIKEDFAVQGILPCAEFVSSFRPVPPYAGGPGGKTAGGVNSNKYFRIFNEEKSSQYSI